MALRTFEQGGVNLPERYRHCVPSIHIDNRRWAVLQTIETETIICSSRKLDGPQNGFKSEKGHLMYPKTIAIGNVLCEVHVANTPNLCSCEMLTCVICLGSSAEVKHSELFGTFSSFLVFICFVRLEHVDLCIVFIYTALPIVRCERTGLKFALSWCYAHMNREV